jgi:hypothetical protein
MSDQDLQGGVGSEEQQGEMAMLQSLLLKRAASDDPGAGMLFASSSNPAMRGLDAQGGMPPSNLLHPFHGTDQALFHQRAMDNMAFGAGLSNSHQMPGMQQPSEDIMLLSRQLLQQQQLQLQQQQQLLLHAGGYPGTGLGAGSAIGGSFGGGRGAGDSLLGAGFLGQSLAGNHFPLSQQRGFNIQAPPLESHVPSSGALGAPDSSTGQRRCESFPMTLHRLLMDLEIAGATHIAAYVAIGDAFLIRNPKAFEERIISKYFPRMGSFGSFQRQLNLYDFKRVAQGAHRGAYTHPLFRRQLPHLARTMKRTKIKGLRRSFKKEKEETPLPEVAAPINAGEGEASLPHSDDDQSK